MLSKNDEDFTNILRGKPVSDADPEILEHAEALRDVLLACKEQENLPPLRLYEHEPTPPPTPPLWQKIKNWVCGENYCPIGRAFATVLVLPVVIALVFWLCSSPKGPIDISYDKVISSNSSVLQTVLESSWKDVTADKFVLRFSGSSSSSSPAMQAFSAGLWRGKQDLLSLSSNLTDEKWLKKDWSKTQWASYFNLGRWTLLLESVCRSIPQYEVPKEFWNEQQQIFKQLNDEFLARKGLNDETEETELEWVLSIFEEYIGPPLKQLSNDNKPQLYANLAEELKLMREGLVP